MHPYGYSEVTLFTHIYNCFFSTCYPIVPLQIFRRRLTYQLRSGCAVHDPVAAFVLVSILLVVMRHRQRSREAAVSEAMRKCTPQRISELLEYSHSSYLSLLTNSTNQSESPPCTRPAALSPPRRSWACRERLSEASRARWRQIQDSTKIAALCLS